MSLASRPKTTANTACQKPSHILSAQQSRRSQSIRPNKIPKSSLSSRSQSILLWQKAKHLQATTGQKHSFPEKEKISNYKYLIEKKRFVLGRQNCSSKTHRKQPKTPK
jgi:hypothetical protein